MKWYYEIAPFEAIDSLIDHYGVSLEEVLTLALEGKRNFNLCDLVEYVELNSEEMHKDFDDLLAKKNI